MRKRFQPCVFSKAGTRTSPKATPTPRPAQETNAIAGGRGEQTEAKRRKKSSSRKSTRGWASKPPNPCLAKKAFEPAKPKRRRKPRGRKRKSKERARKRFSRTKRSEERRVGKER